MSTLKAPKLKKIIPINSVLKSNLRSIQKKLKVAVSEGTYLLDYFDIIRIQASGNYSIIYTKNEEPIIASKPLKYFESQLPKEQFIRIHSGHLVSINQLYFIHKKEVTLKDSTVCPISRSNKVSLKVLMDFM